jgi:hypothetical protein
MARFKTLKQKEKRYTFDFLGNKDDPQPAAVVFARFPLPDETFMPKVKISMFDGLDFGKLGKKDTKEVEKFAAAFHEYYLGNMVKIDYEYFVRECIDHFEDFHSDGKEIKTVDDFLSLNVEMRTLIAHDCWQYAQQRDEFTLGE